MALPRLQQTWVLLAVMAAAFLLSLLRLSMTLMPQLWPSLDIQWPESSDDDGRCSEFSKESFHKAEYEVVTEGEPRDGTWWHDVSGTARLCSGDVFESTARGVSDNGEPLLAPGWIHDEGNGSYVASFYLMWSGDTTFEVQLYLPAHAAKTLTQEIDTADPGPAYLTMWLHLPWGQEIPCSVDPDSKSIARKQTARLIFKSHFEVHCAVAKNFVGYEKCTVIEDITENHACHGLQRASAKAVEECARACCRLPSCQLYEYDPHRGCRLGMNSNCVKGSSKMVSYPDQVRHRLRTDVTEESLQALYDYLEYRGQWGNDLAAKQYTRPLDVKLILSKQIRALIRKSVHVLPGEAGVTTVPPADLYGERQQMGYWRNETYVSLPGPGHFAHISNESLFACLKRYSRIYFIGDSTLRQLAKLLSPISGAKMTSFSKYFATLNLDRNTRADFYFHGHPIAASALMSLNDTLGPGELKVLADITGSTPRDAEGRDILIVLSFGHHFLHSPWHYSKARFDALNMQLTKLHATLPQAKIVFRNANRREDHPRFYRFTNAHKLQLINKYIRESLPDFVIYIDIWPMTRMHPFSMDVHLPDSVIRTEWDMVAEALGCQM